MPPSRLRVLSRKPVNRLDDTALAKAGDRVGVEAEEFGKHLFGVLAQLRAAGIQVVVEDTQGAQELCEGFAKHIQSGIPFLTAKFAMSLDGKIATHTGDSRDC